jgi:hypothetical protein
MQFRCRGVISADDLLPSRRRLWLSVTTNTHYCFLGIEELVLLIRSEGNPAPLRLSFRSAEEFLVVSISSNQRPLRKFEQIFEDTR